MLKILFFISSVCLSVNLTYADSIVLDELVYQIRDPQTKAPLFRESLEKIGEYLALQIADELDYQEETVVTLTGKEATVKKLKENPVLVTALRAGLSLHYGVQKVFKFSDSSFLGVARDEKSLEAKRSYVALSPIAGKTVIIIDTMLATGGTMLDAISLIKAQNPKKIYIVSAIASKFGIEKVKNTYPDVELFVAAIDPDLNDKGFILPGLGDAGDRAYGEKVEIY